MIAVPVEYANELRHVYDIAKEFVTEQGKGEWSEEDIKEDASSLAYLLTKYAQAVIADRERSN